MDDDNLHDLFSGLGRVSIKRLFGGKGIYCDGLIIALVLQDELLLKADAQSAGDFIDAGCTQLTYGRKGKTPVAMPYWSVPEEAFDDPDIMTLWAKRAFEAARRTRK